MQRERQTMSEEQLLLAEAVRAACLRAALSAYESASMDGLCSEGAFEVAIDAVRGLNLAEVCARTSGAARPD